MAGDAGEQALAVECCVAGGDRFVATSAADARLWDRGFSELRALPIAANGCLGIARFAEETRIEREQIQCEVMTFDIQCGSKTLRRKVFQRAERADGPGTDRLQDRLGADGQVWPSADRRSSDRDPAEVPRDQQAYDAPAVRIPGARGAAVCVPLFLAGPRRAERGRWSAGAARFQPLTLGVRERRRELGRVVE